MTRYQGNCGVSVAQSLGKAVIYVRRNPAMVTPRWPVRVL